MIKDELNNLSGTLKQDIMGLIKKYEDETGVQITGINVLHLGIKIEPKITFFFNPPCTEIDR